MDKKLNIEKFRQSVNLIFDHLEKDLQIKDVNVSDEQNLYWNVALNEAHDVNSDISELLVGSVKDDYEFLSNMLDEADDSSDAPSLMLEHAAGLFRYIAMRVGS